MLSECPPDTASVLQVTRRIARGGAGLPRAPVNGAETLAASIARGRLYSCSGGAGVTSQACRLLSREVVWASARAAGAWLCCPRRFTRSPPTPHRTGRCSQQRHQMQNYTVVRKLGTGTYGSAYLCTLKSDPTVQLVLKKVKVDDGDGAQVSADSEVKVLCTLDHPLVLQVGPGTQPDERPERARRRYQRRRRRGQHRLDCIAHAPLRQPPCLMASLHA
jgi:hypothetical protein